MAALKPVAFFSHSSDDKEIMLRLKSQLERKLANSINVFLDCDCQCIRFGDNWDAVITCNLEQAKVVFVFLSPGALRSHWVPYEAGYLSGLKKRVIPVGIRGVDVRSIPNSPFPRLQGFNISSRDGLNNVIQVINEELADHDGYPDLKFELSFEDCEYAWIFGVEGRSVVFGEHEYLVDRVERMMEWKCDNAVDPIVEHLRKCGIKSYVERYSSDETQINADGSEVKVLNKSGVNRIVVSIDPMLAHVVSKAIENVLVNDGVRAESGWQILLNARVDVSSSAVRRSALCHGTGIETFEWERGDQKFRVVDSKLEFYFKWDAEKRQWRIVLVPMHGSLDTYGLRDVLKILCNCGIVQMRKG